MADQLPRPSDSELRMIKDRDRWRCTAMIAHRITGEVGRCPIVGSEMVVADGRTYCPRHIPDGARAF